jgi:alpha-N-arabinofuranosidase
VQIDIATPGKLLPQAEAIVITSEKREDTNSITDPKKIMPKSMKISVSGNTFDYEFKPNSITVLKINQTK